MRSTTSPAPILAILGPTAIGKTAVGVEIAIRLEAEIVSADSRQIYRQLDIGTAKPSLEERAQVKHHFVDELDLMEPFSAGAFAEAARRRIADMFRRAVVPIVVGGSTLYVQALFDGLADIPPVPDAVRQQVQGELDTSGMQVMYKRLQEFDPAGAAQTDPSNTRRIQRMLEVWYTTGKPLSHYWREHDTPPLPSRRFILNMDRKCLYERIDRRVDVMFDSGLIHEVEAILQAGYDRHLPPLQTIGYQECIPYLDGEISLSTARRLVARNTRRYAKRQLTWLRRYEDATWLEITPHVSPAELAEIILEKQRS